MADFPTSFTNAIPEITPIMAKHLNNLEIKVGIDYDPNVASLDYMVRARVTNSIFGIDHDIATGYHKLGNWHIGTDLVTASALELNALDGIGVTVTSGNLTYLTDGTDIGLLLHQHGIYRVPDNKSLSSTYWAGTYPNLNAISKRPGFLLFWYDFNTSLLYVLPKVVYGGALVNLRIRLTISPAHFDTVYAYNWTYDNAQINQIDWGGSDGPFTHPTNPANSGPDKFYWGGTDQSCEFSLDATGSGDAFRLHLHTFGADWKETTITAEIISTGGNQGFDQVILGSMVAASCFGNPGQRIIFNLGGKVLEIL